MISVLGQSIIVILTVAYAMLVVMATRLTYRLMVDRGVEENVAIYYNRKIVHMAAGGVASFLVPILFVAPIYPMLTGLLLSVLVYIPYRTGKRLFWLQTAENKNDVKFTMMWGLSIFLLWTLFEDPWLAIIPSVFMAFGDGVTGIVRNAFFKRRTKSWIGNFFMVLVCIPLGYLLGNAAQIPIPWWGVVAAIFSSFIEHFEFGPIDDNILITASATAVLFVGAGL